VIFTRAFEQILLDALLMSMTHTHLITHSFNVSLCCLFWLMLHTAVVQLLSSKQTFWL